MARVIYSREALEDFGRLIEFSLGSAPDSAAPSADRIRGAISILTDHPLIGRRRDAWRRELVISRGRTGYLAMYRYDVSRDIVFILRIRHQREAGFAE